MKQFESFRLDTVNECLWRNGAQISLPPKPYAILRYLVDNPGRLITHDELLDALWPETYVQPQVLRTYMLDLRKVLGDDPGAPRFIQTVPKRGYSFIASVKEGAEATSPAGRPAVALPGEPGRGLVDREAELERLEMVFQLAERGQRQIALVTGAAGIGKTALVDAFAGRVGAAQAARIGRGQCVEGLGGREEYYPVMEALSQLCASADGERACRVLARMAPSWLPAVVPDGARSSAAKMPGELCAALEELASDKPLVLVLEDLHWADHATCSLISALGRRRATARLMILATYRPQTTYRWSEDSTESAVKGMRQDLLLHRLCTEIGLEAFGRAQVGGLIRHHLGQEALPDGLDDFVYQHSEGNPLFVIAIVEHLIAQQQLARDAKSGRVQWRKDAAVSEMSSSVPDELAQMIELEIGRLSGADQRLLEAASLMPIAFPAWTVAAALGEDASDTEEACDEIAGRLYFVRRVGQDELPDGSRSAFYVFAHGLYREVLYQRQPAARRARRHVRIAERLMVLFAGRESSVAREIAQHYEAAGEWQQAAYALRAAADAARERGAQAEAAALLDSACAMAENLNDADRARLVLELRAEVAGLVPDPKNS